MDIVAYQATVRAVAPGRIHSATTRSMVVVEGSPGASFLYLHVVRTKSEECFGREAKTTDPCEVAVGDKLGVVEDNCDWPPHMHFGELAKGAQELTVIRNPLLDLDPSLDVLPPTFSAVEPVLFFRADPPAPYYELDPQQLTGRVDVVVEVFDTVLSSRVAPYSLSAELWLGEERIRTWSSFVLDDRLYLNNKAAAQTLYRIASNLGSTNHPGLKQRRFFYVLTNSDFALPILESEAGRHWNTMLCPNGQYRVRVAISDIANAAPVVHETTVTIQNRLSSAKPTIRTCRSS